MLLSLQHVHSKQILHRDLKTQNILMDKKHQVVKIGDFGISKVLSSKSKAYTVSMNYSHIYRHLGDSYVGIHLIFLYYTSNLSAWIAMFEKNICSSFPFMSY